MKKISFVAGKSFQGNVIFNRNQTKLKVGSFGKYYQLFDEYLAKDYVIATDDMNHPNDSDVVLYFDMPKEIPKKEDIKKSYLLAIESAIIRPENFDKKKHEYFKKIFTWNDDLVDGKKYIKINYSFDFPITIYKKINRKKLCCLIASNKSSNFKNELYSERKKLIRWFEKNFINEFDLYGYGWDQYRFSGPKFLRILNRLPLVPRVINMIPGIRYPSYKGTVSNKIDVMRGYRFAIAYENVMDEMGYITEKIFDVFIAGSVPVYWGAKNVLDYIPSDCFLDRRNFNSDLELFKFMKGMSDNYYLQYLINIENFLNSDQAQQFTTQNFAKTIVNNTSEGV